MVRGILHRVCSAVTVLSSRKSGRTRLRNTAAFSGSLQHELQSDSVPFSRNLEQQAGELLNLSPYFFEVTLFGEQPREPKQ